MLAVSRRGRGGWRGGGGGRRQGLRGRGDVDGEQDGGVAVAVRRLTFDSAPSLQSLSARAMALRLTRAPVLKLTLSSTSASALRKTEKVSTAGAPLDTSLSAHSALSSSRVLVTRSVGNLLLERCHRLVHLVVKGIFHAAPLVARSHIVVVHAEGERRLVERDAILCRRRRRRAPRGGRRRGRCTPARRRG